jgi:hypothetical protein
MASPASKPHAYTHGFGRASIFIFISFVESASILPTRQRSLKPTTVSVHIANPLTRLSPAEPATQLWPHISQKPLPRLRVNTKQFGRIHVPAATGVVIRIDLAAFDRTAKHCLAHTSLFRSLPHCQYVENLDEPLAQQLRGLQ